MKKFNVLFRFVVVFIILFSVKTSYAQSENFAEQIELAGQKIEQLTEHEDEAFMSIIQNLEQSYLMECKVDEHYMLTLNQKNKLDEEIQKLKLIYQNKERFLDKKTAEKIDKENRSSYRYSSKWIDTRPARQAECGDILISYDQITGFFRHGHAGIAGWAEGSTVEANPGDGVRVYKSGLARWKDYKTGGRYQVKNASLSHYNGAAEYAYWKASQGTKYTLYPTDGKTADYCSGLVYRAWKSEGFNVGKVGLTLKFYVLPKDIANNPNTYLVESW